MSGPGGAEAGGSPPRASIAMRVENGATVAILCAMTALPLVEMAGRRIWGFGIQGSSQLVQHGTLWLGMLGGAVAARDGRLLAAGSVDPFPAGMRAPAAVFAAGVSAAVSFLLCLAGVQLVLVEWNDRAMLVPYLPVWAAQAVMPLGFALVTGRLIGRASPSLAGRAATAAIGAAIAGVAYSPWIAHNGLFGLLLAFLLAAVVFGAPLFAGLGGVAVLLFRHADVPLASIPVEVYRMVTSPTLPTLPLFAFAGYLLTGGKASLRLVRLFRALVGWMPGAVAVAAILVASFFTTFTGASGVTILALGGILYPALIAERYPERFSLGLMTTSGSLGMLFPPCLPVILYAVVAGIAVDKMFLGGFLPGILLTVAVSAHAVRTGLAAGTRRTPFDARELLCALREAKWDILLPVVVLVGIFSGLTTIVEAAAVTVSYALLVERFVHRDVSLRRDLPRLGTESGSLVGGVLLILAAAMGLTNYMVDAGVPAALLAFTREAIHSKVVFLLALNAVLLIVGCLMDIFSAIVVVVPIISPMAAAFGVHPVHMGVIFLANLQLGFLTPPIGMNLFLSAYRFERPFVEVCRAIVPFLLILLGGVLAITYIPALSTALLP